MAKQIAFVAVGTKRARGSLQQPKSWPLIARLDLVCTDLCWSSGSLCLLRGEARLLRDGSINQGLSLSNLAGKLNLGSKFSTVVTYYVASLLIFGERRVETLNLCDISRAVVTSSKQLFSKC